MKTKDVTAAAEIVIGCFYLVPCVFSEQGFFTGTWVPVNGPQHRDAEIGTPAEHFHIDYRFLDASLLKRAQRLSPLSVLALIMTMDRDTDGKIAVRRMRCKRSAPIFPEWRGSRTLEEAFVGAELKCWRCPHRGSDLRAVEPKGGVVVCPGHGLAFRDGKCVQRSLI